MNSIEALHPGPTSAEVIESIFSMHFKSRPGHYDYLRILDMTAGKLVFWNWDYRKEYPWCEMWFNDKYIPALPDSSLDHSDKVHYDQHDFTNLPYPDHYFDIAVFDPPHTAHGPSTDSVRYGSSRNLAGAPQNIHEVQDLLARGIEEATRVAQLGVIIKTMDVIESGFYQASVFLACGMLSESKFKCIDQVYFLPSRRPQPDEARGATVKHFRNRPSIFIVGKPRNAI